MVMRMNLGEVLRTTIKILDEKEKTRFAELRIIYKAPLPKYTADYHSGNWSLRHIWIQTEKRGDRFYHSLYIRLAYNRVPNYEVQLKYPLSKQKSIIHIAKTITPEISTIYSIYIDIQLPLKPRESITLSLIFKMVNLNTIKTIEEQIGFELPILSAEDVSGPKETFIIQPMGSALKMTPGKELLGKIYQAHLNLKNAATQILNKTAEFVGIVESDFSQADKNLKEYDAALDNFMKTRDSLVKKYPIHQKETARMINEISNKLTATMKPFMKAVASIIAKVDVAKSKKELFTTTRAANKTITEYGNYIDKVYREALSKIETEPQAKQVFNIS
jgi:signal recognition particle subunit SEC65